MVCGPLGICLVKPIFIIILRLCLFHCVNICTDGTKVVVGKIAGTLSSELTLWQQTVLSRQYISTATNTQKTGKECVWVFEHVWGRLNYLIFFKEHQFYLKEWLTHKLWLFILRYLADISWKQNKVSPSLQGNKWQNLLPIINFELSSKN